MTSIWQKKNIVPALLFLPALLQLLIFFVGKDLYPFSNNEMYAGHPSAENFQVVYLIGVKDGKEFASRSQFQQEMLSPVIDSEIEKPQPDFNHVCELMNKERRKDNLVNSIRIERRSWNKISKSNVLKPDSIEVMHECQYR
jgi:hypothetical protein